MDYQIQFSIFSSDHLTPSIFSAMPKNAYPVFHSQILSINDSKKVSE
jgi:hypothetical protein